MIAGHGDPGDDLTAVGIQIHLGFVRSLDLGTESQVKDQADKRKTKMVCSVLWHQVLLLNRGLFAHFILPPLRLKIQCNPGRGTG